MVTRGFKGQNTFSLHIAFVILTYTGLKQEITPMDASNLLQEDYLDLLSTRVLEVEMESVSVEVFRADSKPSHMYYLKAVEDNAM